MRNIIAAAVILIVVILFGALAWTRLGLRERVTRSTTDTLPLSQTPQATFYPFATPTNIPLITLPTGSGKSTATPIAIKYACQYLLAEPATGTAPFTVKLTATGIATSGTGRTYTFDFGEGTPVTQTGTSVSHTYNAPGTYISKLEVRDLSDKKINLGFEECRRTIVVQGKPTATTGGKTTTLPKTGPETLLMLLLAPITGVGIYLYKRFKLL